MAGGLAAVLGAPRAAIAVGPPAVTAANITVTSIGSGTGGAYVPGDTVTVAWDNSATGDNNAGIVSVTADLSPWGLGGALTAYDDGSTCGDAGIDQVWTACGSVSAGVIDSAAATATITAANGVAPTTTADDAAYPVDNQAPTVTAANITVTGATGTGGAFKIGDTVKVTWNGAADGNSDTDLATKANLSGWGGGAAVSMIDDGSTCGDTTASDDIRVACYTLIAGAIDTAGAQTSVKGYDDAGNFTGPVADDPIYTVDTAAPTVTAANMFISATCSGAGGACVPGDTVEFIWNDTALGDNNADAIASVAGNLAAFGGGAAQALAEDDGGAVQCAGGTGGADAGLYCFTLTIGAGSNDDAAASWSLTATDDAGNATTQGDTDTASVDNKAPTVTDGNISISTGSGTGGAFKIGDTVTATWDGTAGGDNNGDISSVTVDFTAFGGGAAVTASNAAGMWTANLGIFAGGLDAANLNVSVTATDDAGNATTSADTSNATVDNQRPTVTAANISVTSTGSGVGGAYKIGDTVIVEWNAGLDGNLDLAGATANLSAWGGGAAVAMTDTGCGGAADAVLEACYTLAAGTVDTSAAEASVTAKDDVNNGTVTLDGAQYIVDNQFAITAGNVSVAGATGTLGAFKAGDTVTVTWNDSASGDNNAELVGAPTADLSAWGGGAAVAMTDTAVCGGTVGDGVYEACYTILGTEGIDVANAEASVTATDDAGNTGSALDGAQYAVDTAAPTVTDGNISVSGASGTGGAFKIGDTVTATWDDTAGGDNNGDISSVTVDFTAFGGGAAVTASNAAGMWTATYVIAAGIIDANSRDVSVTVLDDAGNTATSSDTTNSTVDNQAPAVTAGNITVTTVGSGTGGAYVAGDTVTVEWNDGATGDNNGTEVVSATADLSGWGGGAAVAMADDGATCGDATAGDRIYLACDTLGAGSIDTNATASVSATDDAGNVGTAGDDSSYPVDNQAPAITAANITVSGATGTAGAFIVGDTVIVEWNDSASGDDNGDIASATADLSGWGGGAAVAMADDGATCGDAAAGDRIYVACYTIAGTEGIDDADNEASVAATDDAGNAVGAVLDGTQYAVDTNLPTVTASNISVTSAGTGTGGAYVAGDTVTIEWNDGATGDNNGTEVVSATADLSGWGGGAAVAMVDDGSACGDTPGDGVYTACDTLATGAIDTAFAEASVSVVDDAGNGAGPTLDGSQYAVDNAGPAISDPNVAVTSTGSGTGGTYIIGDVVTVSWDDSPAGDNNGAEVVTAVADLSAWGGGASVAMTDTTACGGTAGDGVYEACATLVSASEDTASAQAAVTATDDAGNTASVTDSSVYTVDDMEPAVNASYISVSGATGSSGYFKTGDTVTVEWDNSSEGNADLAGATADLSAWGGGAAVAMTDTTACGGTAADDIYEACYTLATAPYSTGNAASVTATDDAGNSMTAADDQTYQIGTTSSGGGGGGGGAASVPTLTVTAPNGGESLVPGNVYVLQWNSLGGSQPYVAIKLSVDGGTTYPSIIAANDPNIGTFRWTVPDVATTMARVKVESKDFVGAVQASDVSDANFIILGSQAPTAPEQPLPPSSDQTIDELREEFQNFTSATAGEAMEREDADDALPSVAPVDTLVKLASDGNPATDADTTVYYIGLDAKRHPFPTLAMFLSWHPDFSDVKEVDAATLASIPLGKPIMARPGTVWVKIQSDPKVYYVEPGNLLRWVKDEAAARALGGENWNANIIDVDPSLFVQYTPHDTIDLSSLAQSWPGGQLVRENESAPTYYVGQDSRRPVDAAGFAKNMFQERFLRTTGSASWLDAMVGAFVCDREDGLYSLMH